MALRAADEDLVPTLNVPLTAESTGVRPSLRAKGMQQAIAAVPTLKAAPVSIEEKPEVAGYELHHIIGRGGEGTVWEATEKKLERRVAIKIHARIRESENASNLWTEAKVAARIGDPSIVTVLDVGLTLDGRRYYAMELVRGTDVAELIARGPLTARRAVEIAADVARAVAAAHQHGVVHRDLKPRNVIVDAANRARVVDFGIALDLRSNLGDHLAGMIAGSPKYMAPEQIRGETIGPATDIWAMGVLLFEMLTGHSPFQRASMLDILDAVVAGRFEPASTIVPGIHRDIEAIIGRCLSVKPEERFSSATALHECLRAVLEGHEVSVAHTNDTFSYQPRASYDDAGNERPRRENADKHLAWTWQLKAAPKDLWPHLSDTQRWSEAVGLHPMAIATELDGTGRLVHKGTHHTLGQDHAWQEFPGEWIEEREVSKFRWYSQGPFQAMWTRLALKPLENGGTELSYEVWAITRGLYGRIVSFVDLERRFARAVDRYVHRIDALLANGQSVDNAHSPSRRQRARVGAAMTLLRAQGFDERILQALEQRLLHAPDTALAPLRPHALADAWKTSREETADAFINAAKHGILVPTFGILCPVCRVTDGAHPTLKEIGEKGRCTRCLASFNTDLESSVELVFVPSKDVRRPANAVYCFDPPARRPHVRAQRMLWCRDEIVIPLELEPGAYKIVAAHTKATFDLLVTATGFAASTRVSYDGTRFSGGGPTVVRAGKLELRLRNTSKHEEYFRIENTEKQGDVFGAAAALTHPAFRELFGEQLPQKGLCLPVRELAFVFVRASSNEIVERLGDARACMELSRFADRITDEAHRFQGTLVPSSLGAMTMAFASDAQAVRAALAMRTMLDHGFALGVSIAVHAGSCVSVAREGRVEFFGETVNRGESLVASCPNGSITVSESLMANRKIALLVHESGKNSPILRS